MVNLIYMSDKRVLFSRGGEKLGFGVALHRKARVTLVEHDKYGSHQTHSPTDQTMQEYEQSALLNQFDFSKNFASASNKGKGRDLRVMKGQTRIEEKSESRIIPD